MKQDAQPVELARAAPRGKLAAGERSQAAAPRVIRGGSWNNDPQNARSAYRNRNTPENRNNNLGFRLARAQRARWTPRRIDPIARRFRRLPAGQILTSDRPVLVAHGEGSGRVFSRFRSPPECTSGPVGECTSGLVGNIPNYFVANRVAIS